MIDKKFKISKFNKFLNSLPFEKIKFKNEKEIKKAKKDFEKLKDGLSRGMCSFCGYSLAHFSVNKPCFHWLLKPNGFKKKHFPILFKEKSYNQIDAYLRWVANCDKYIQNINDLKEEKSSNKFIETTIIYKNLEWSFSCSHSDLEGHKNKHKGRLPHYHFQMKVDDNVIINYAGFHIPFSDYDEFCFAVERNDFDRLKSIHTHGAGMQSLKDNLTPEELVDGLKYTEDESNAQLNTNILIMAEKGSTISGEEITKLLEEREKTGVSMAKLAYKLKNVNIQIFISPGPAVPKIASRKPRKNKNRA